MLTSIVNAPIVATVTFCVAKISICVLNQMFMERCKILITLVFANSSKTVRSQIKNRPNFRLIGLLHLSRSFARELLALEETEGQPHFTLDCF